LAAVGLNPDLDVEPRRLRDPRFREAELTAYEYQCAVCGLGLRLGPLAVAIMGGLSVATFLTLGNLPALYVLLFRVRRPTQPPAPAPYQGTGGRAGYAGGAGEVPLVLANGIPSPNLH